MKKIFFGGIAIVAIAAAVAFSVNVKSNDYGLSDLALRNAEALANPVMSCPCCVYCPYLTPWYICTVHGSSGIIASCPSQSNVYP